LVLPFVDAGAEGFALEGFVLEPLALEALAALDA